MSGGVVREARDALERARVAGYTEERSWVEAHLAADAALDDAIETGARGEALRPLERLRDAIAGEALGPGSDAGVPRQHG